MFTLVAALIGVRLFLELLLAIAAWDMNRAGERTIRPSTRNAVFYSGPIYTRHGRVVSQSAFRRAI